MILKHKVEILHRLIGQTGADSGVGVVVKGDGVFGLYLQGLEVVGERVIVILQLIVLLGDVGIDAAELPAIGGGHEELFDGLLTLSEFTVDDTERISNVGVVWLLAAQSEEYVQSRLGLVVSYIPVSAADLHLGAVGIELFGIVDGGGEGLEVLDLKVVVNNDFQLVDIEELAVAPEDGALEVKHEFPSLVVVVCEAVVGH